LFHVQRYSRLVVPNFHAMISHDPLNQPNSAGSSIIPPTTNISLSVPSSPPPTYVSDTYVWRVNHYSPVVPILLLMAQTTACWSWPHLLSSHTRDGGEVMRILIISEDAPT